MSGHFGLDALGWDDRAVRLVETGPEPFRVVAGPASVVELPGWTNSLVAGEAAALAGAGRIAGCGERRPLLQHPPGTERGRCLWPVHLRWLAGDARRAVLAIPDSPDWNEARRQTLIDAAQRARLDPILLWRSVAILLGLPAHTLPAPVQGAEAVLISLTAEATTVSSLGLEADRASGLLTPLRRRCGSALHERESRGLEIARRAAADVARQFGAPDAAERLLWSTPTVAGILAGRSAAAPDILLADGRWLVDPVQSPDISYLGGRLMAAVGAALRRLQASPCAVVVEGPFAACPAPGGSVGSQILDLAARLFPGAVCLLTPPGAAAAGAAEHARRLSLGLPTYFDFLPQMEIAAYRDDEPGFVPLIRRTDRIAGNRTYKDEVVADFAIAAGTQELSLFLALEDEAKTRVLKMQLSPAPSADVAVRLHVEQRPAQGHARVEIMPKEEGGRTALGRGLIVLDWQRLEKTELDRDQVLEGMQRGYGWPTELAYLRAHRALWELPVTVGSSSLMPRDLLERFLRVPQASIGSPQHLALIKAIRSFLTQKRDPSRIPKARWQETGKHGPLDSNGEPPKDLPVPEARLLERLRAEVARLLGLVDLKPAVRSQLVLVGGWLYAAAPEPVVEDFRRRLRDDNLPATLAQAAGRCLTSTTDLRSFYALLHQRRTEERLGQPEIKAAAESLQWRGDAPAGLTALSAQGLTIAALDAMRRERQRGNFKQSYRWAQQLLFALLRFRMEDRHYLARRSERWAQLRGQVQAEVDACLAAVTGRSRTDLAKGLRDYLEYLDSRAHGGGLIVENDPYRADSDEGDNVEE